jgi:hypothetical protein
MSDTYSLQDIIDHMDVLIEMMTQHEESLYGAIDMVNQVKDEISHQISAFTDEDE